MSPRRDNRPGLGEFIATGLFMAAGLSVVALVVVGVGFLVTVFGGDTEFQPASELPVALLYICLSYFTAAPIAATALWLLHPIKQSFLGCVLRGAVLAPIIYGVVGFASVLLYVHAGVNIMDYESTEEARTFLRWSFPIFAVAGGLIWGPMLFLEVRRESATRPGINGRSADPSERVEPSRRRYVPWVMALAFIVAAGRGLWPRVTVSLVEPARVDRLEFQLRSRRFLGGAAEVSSFRMRACRPDPGENVGDLIWAIDTPGEGVELDRLQYGRAPAGLLTVEAPKTLEPGRCYWIIHPGPDDLYILFDADGSGREIALEEAQVHF